MWNVRTVDHLGTGTGCAPVHFPDNLSGGSTNVEFFPLNGPNNNHGIENSQTNHCQATNWLDIMSDQETVILDENDQKSDDLADISPTVQVDESDFMHYTIEEMKLEWPQELKFSTPGTAGFASPVPVPAPVPAPERAPVPAPVRAPVPAPVRAPVPAHVRAPLPAPVRAPVPAPVRAPLPAPVPASVRAPVPAPVRAPVPGILKVTSPLPVLSTLAVSGVLRNLRPLSPPPAPRPSFFVSNRPINHFARLPPPVCHNKQPSIQNLLYLPLALEHTQKAFKSNRQVQLQPPSKWPPANDTKMPSRQMSDVETDTASDTSWRESSDDDFAKKFEREDQMEEILLCYQTGGINTDDNFIYCDLCNRRWCRVCPQHGRLKHVRDQKVPTGIEGRARKTAPRFLSILPSKIPGAKNGVWTSRSIPKRTYFGPYEGCEVPLDRANGEYCWKVMRDGKPKYLVDGSDPTRSNWMRYVNCARTAEEQNLEAFQFKGAIFYRTTKDIDAKQELLVWYGFKFAQKLGIKWKDFVESNLPDKRGIAFPCGSCFHAYSNPITLERHWKRSRCKHSSSLFKDSASEGTAGRENEGSSICMEVTTGDMPITCGVCGARFRRRGKPLQYHMKSHSDRKHNCCLKCGQWFPDESALNKHKIAASPTLKDSAESALDLSRQGGVICDTKPNKIRSKPVKTEPQLPECTESRRSTRGTSESGVNEDRPLSHTGNVPVVDPPVSHTEVNEDRLISNAGASNDQLISNSGKNNDDLISRDDSTENQSSDQVKGTSGPVLRSCKDMSLCDKCGAMFVRTSLLVSHLEKQHGIQSKERELFAKTCQPKRFRCKECGILYRKKETLEQHLKLHEDTSDEEPVDAGDEKKFACNKCEMKFRAEVTLQFHMKVHKETSEISAVLSQPTKKFKCKECHVRFRAKSTLKLHMRTHEKEKRYTKRSGPNLRPRSNQTFFTGSIFKHTPKTEEGAELQKTRAESLSGGGQSGVGIVQDGNRNSLQQGQPKVPKRKDSHPGGVPTKRPRRVLSLECLACGFIFKGRACLDAHVRKHTEEKMLVCDLSRVRVAE